MIKKLGIAGLAGILAFAFGDTIRDDIVAAKKLYFEAKEAQSLYDQRNYLAAREKAEEIMARIREEERYARETGLYFGNINKPKKIVTEILRQIPVYTAR